MSNTPNHFMGGFTNQRRRYFVDPSVQGALLRQALWYWLSASATFMFIIFIYRVIPPWLSGKSVETGQIWYHFAPYLVASAVLFPIVAFRAIRFSHHFCGPMIPIRRALKQLAHGDSTPVDIRLRRTDYWKDIADDINAVNSRFSQMLQTSTADSNSDDDNPVPPFRDEECAEQLGQLGAKDESIVLSL